MSEKPKRKKRGGGCRRIIVLGVAAFCGLTVIAGALRPPAQPSPLAPLPVTRQASLGEGGQEGATATIAPSATITDTPAPSATISSEVRVRAIMESVVIGDVGDIHVTEIGETRIIAAGFEMPQNFDGYNVRFTGQQMAQIMCKLRDEAGFGAYRIQLSGMIDLVDAFGNEFTEDGFTVMVEPGTLARINCANWASVNLEAIADRYELHRLLQ